MVDVDRAVVAKINIRGHEFEILVDCDKALEFKQGKAPIEDALATDLIFKDVKKGEKASENLIQETFKTTDVKKVAEIIIKKGKIQLTAKHFEKQREELKKQLINLIHRNAIDPKTSLPHPPQRIENAIKEAKINIDANKTAEQQVESVLDKLRPIIPIKFEKRELEIRIPPKFASQSFHVLKKFSKILKEEWQNDGSLKANVQIPSGIQDEFFSELNKLCHGEVESKIIKVI